MRTICSMGIFGLLLFLVGPALTQTASDQDIADFAQKAAIRALNFKQGDLHGLTGARDNFTPEGWKQYLKSLGGFLDDQGACSRHYSP